MALNRNQIAAKVNRYIMNNFNTGREAATHYDISRAYISQIRHGKRSPTPRMLRDIGYERKIVWVKK